MNLLNILNTVFIYRKIFIGITLKINQLEKEQIIVILSQRNLKKKPSRFASVRFGFAFASVLWSRCRSRKRVRLRKHTEPLRGSEGAKSRRSERTNAIHFKEPFTCSESKINFRPFND
uniref:Uncharacterized protein n=1 Tax=Hydrodictyon reticulatum TaxID=3107 RepID=A0A1W5RP16_HYDRE|nr:hypothetical protein [Hydrodictyon reticulatum]AQU64588.1 hypothetical protein [Hydrodictyon reticulatum]